MWISRTKLSDELKKKYREGLEKGRELERVETAPFSDYYKERLEYWKGQFDKKPEPHCIKIWLVGGGWKETSSYDSFEAAKAQRDAIVFELQEKGTTMVGDIVLMKDAVAGVDITEGHPSPYTPEEIESWAKERVEEEMKGWKVVDDSLQRHLERSKNIWLKQIQEAQNRSLWS